MEDDSKQAPQGDHRFVFPCCRVLAKGLGEFDSAIECNEIAIRHLLSSVGGGSGLTIETLSRKHGVMVNLLNEAVLRLRLSQLHLLSVAQQFEIFLKSFLQEHPDGKAWKIENKRGDDEPLLDWVLCRVGSTRAKAANSTLLNKKVAHAAVGVQ